MEGARKGGERWKVREARVRKMGRKGKGERRRKENRGQGCD